MKGFAMIKLGETGWIEKETPVCGPLDAICKPLALAPCTSDVHTVWEGAIGERHNMILGHEGCGEVVEVGSLVKDFKPGDKVLVPAITPDWNSLEAQGGYSMHSGGMLAGWKFSNFKDGVFGEFFHVNDADGNIAHIPDGVKIEHAPMLSRSRTCRCTVRGFRVGNRHRPGRSYGGCRRCIARSLPYLCGRYPPCLCCRCEILRCNGYYQL